MALTALLDFSDPHHTTAPRLRHAFGPPHTLLVAQHPNEVRAVLDTVQLAAQQGAWCVGYVRYEAASAFDAALQTHTADGPLVWFAIHDAPLPWPNTSDTPDATTPPIQAPTLDWQPQCDGRQAFDAALAHIQQAIACGEFYQVNYTAQVRGTLKAQAPSGPDAACALFAALQRAQPGGYAMYLNTAQTAQTASALEGSSSSSSVGEQILSVSPELFFDWHSHSNMEGEIEGGSILTRPMKGTAPRGATPVQDKAHADALRSSPKERAENVMIVDLLRNDLSRIAKPHSVQVPRLFHLEGLPAVWQMTSDVQATTRPGTGLWDVFSALFPCGSVTGAPKVRAMQAISELESGPRGIYCGAIGVVRPDLQSNMGNGIHATFNVAIRTVVLQGNQARCGIGSGITSGAQAPSEWKEWHHKRAFIEQARMPFDLLETLALHNGQWQNAPAHLARLQSTAQHFSYPWNSSISAQVQQCFTVLAQEHPQGAWRVRLRLSSNGKVEAEAFVMEPSPAHISLKLADRPLKEAHGEFVRYKTTRRAHYDAFAPTQRGIFDTVLFNEEGGITECTRGNIAMLLDGRWVTPPLHCGLLPGVGRALALHQGRLGEQVVRQEDIPRIQSWAFLNSLRGWIAAEVV